MSPMRLSPKIREWLSTATPDQITVFMAKGPLEIGQFGNFDSAKFESTFRSFVRGVMVGKDYFPKAQEAEEDGERILKGLQEKAAALPALDELALGISTDNWTIAELLGEGILQIESMTHLGAESLVEDRFSSFDDPLADFLERITEEDPLPEALSIQIPWLPKLAKELKEIEEDDDDRDEHRSRFLEYCRDNGTLGFLVTVSHPTMSWSPEGNSASFSWGSRNLRIFYGETLLDAIQQAATFYEARDEKGREAARSGVVPAEG